MRGERIGDFCVTSKQASADYSVVLASILSII
jgi:hypothetical protein